MKLDKVHFDTHTAVLSFFLLRKPFEEDNEYSLRKTLYSELPEQLNLNLYYDKKHKSYQIYLGNLLKTFSLEFIVADMRPLFKKQGVVNYDELYDLLGIKPIVVDFTHVPLYERPSKSVSHLLDLPKVILEEVEALLDVDMRVKISRLNQATHTIWNKRPKKLLAIHYPRDYARLVKYAITHPAAYAQLAYQNENAYKNEYTVSDKPLNDFEKLFLRACKNGDFSSIAEGLSLSLVTGDRDMVYYNPLKWAAYYKQQRFLNRVFQQWVREYFLEKNIQDHWDKMSGAVLNDNDLLSLIKSNSFFDIVEENYTISLLHCAIACRQSLEIIQCLIQEGCDINERSLHGSSTPLAVAVLVGYTECVNFLLSLDGIGPNLPDRCWRTPILLAVMHDHLEIVKTLLLSDKIQNALDAGGRFYINPNGLVNPIVNRIQLLHVASQKGYVDILEELLLSKNMNNAIAAARDCSPLFEAIKNRHRCVIDAWFLYEEKNPGFVQFNMDDLLAEAIHNFDVVTIKKLHSLNIDWRERIRGKHVSTAMSYFLISQTNTYGTAVEVFCEIINALLAFPGVDPNGLEVLFLREIRMPPLLVAVNQGVLSIVKALLASEKVDPTRITVDASDFGNLYLLDCVLRPEYRFPDKDKIFLMLCANKKVMHHFISDCGWWSLIYYRNTIKQLKIRVRHTLENAEKVPAEQSLLTISLSHFFKSCSRNKNTFFGGSVEPNFCYYLLANFLLNEKPETLLSAIEMAEEWTLSPYVSSLPEVHLFQVLLADLQSSLVASLEDEQKSEDRSAIRQTI